MSDFEERVRHRLAELQRGPTEAENIGGLGKGFISDILKSRKKDVGISYLDSLAKALDWTIPQLLDLPETDSRDALIIKPQAKNSGDVSQNLPVMGIAAGSIAGSFTINEPVDLVRRPPGLSHATKAYALYVAGASMEPKFETGELIFVNPDRPAVSGDVVIVQTRNHAEDVTQAWVKILVAETAAHVKVKQLNPPATIDFKREIVRSIHRVMKTRELIGI